MSRHLLLSALMFALPWATSAAAEQAALGAGWDWGSFGSIDDAPVGRPAGGSGASPNKPAVPRKPPHAAPDYAAPPRAAYALFKNLPPFEVIPAARDSEMHPCGNCHQWAISNPEPRDLKEPHNDFSLQHGLHGKGKFWCFTCHELKGKGSLKTLEGEPLEFGDAYILCSQCHSDQARDWAYGAHGKRVSGWDGPRQVLNCTACHYQHRPAFKPRAPLAGPSVRMGLERPAHWRSRDDGRAGVHGYEAMWKAGHKAQEATQ